MKLPVLCVNGDTIEVSAFKTDAPGLVVCKMPYAKTDTWHVMHAGSSLGLPGMWRSRDDAKKFAALVAPLADWKLDKNVFKDNGKLAKEVRTISTELYKELYNQPELEFGES